MARVIAERILRNAHSPCLVRYRRADRCSFFTLKAKWQHPSLMYSRISTNVTFCSIGSASGFWGQNKSPSSDGEHSYAKVLSPPIAMPGSSYELSLLPSKARLYPISTASPPSECVYHTFRRQTALRRRDCDWRMPSSYSLLRPCVSCAIKSSVRHRESNAGPRHFPANSGP